MTTTLEEPKVKRRGRPVTERTYQGYRAIREPREFVRRTVTVDLDLDRAVRTQIDADGNTYSGLVEAALRKYLGANAHSTVA